MIKKEKLCLSVLICLLLVSCRGSDENTGDIAFPTTANPDAFAVFLNTAPGVPQDETIADDINNVDDFPEAYYNTIDPEESRDSFVKWLTANGFLDVDGNQASCWRCRDLCGKFSG